MYSLRLAGYSWPCMNPSQDTTEGPSCCELTPGKDTSQADMTAGMDRGKGASIQPKNNKNY